MASLETPKIKKQERNCSYTHESLVANYEGEQVVNILKNLRTSLYNDSRLGDYLSDDTQNGWQGFELFQNSIMGKNAYLTYGRKLPGRFPLTENVGMSRTTSEAKQAGETAKQCSYVVGDFHENAKKKKAKAGYNNERTVSDWKPANFVDEDKFTCWLCSKPLWVGPNVLTPQSEHKNPCYLMAVTNAGLAATRRKKHPNSVEQPGQKKTSKQYSVEGLPEEYYEGQPDILKQIRTWKLMVRGEGMAWSHAYCNNWKSQTPFMSLRHTQDNKYMYIIEYSNIREFVQGLWNKEKGEDMPTSVKNFRQTDEGEKQFFMEHEKQTAINNIIKRLIPLVCLLNQGNDIHDDMWKYCSDIIGKKDKTKRSITNILRDSDSRLSIETRIFQNCTRILAAGACTKGSNIGKVASSEEDRGEMIKNLLEQLFGTLENIQEEEEENEELNEELNEDVLFGKYIEIEGNSHAQEMAPELVEQETPKRKIAEKRHAETTAAASGTTIFTTKKKQSRLKEKYSKLPHPTSGAPKEEGGGRKRRTKRKTKKKRRTKKKKTRRKKRKRTRKKRKRTRRRKRS